MSEFSIKEHFREKPAKYWATCFLLTIIAVGGLIGFDYLERNKGYFSDNAGRNNQNSVGDTRSIHEGNYSTYAPLADSEVNLELPDGERVSQDARLHFTTAKLQQKHNLTPGFSILSSPSLNYLVKIDGLSTWLLDPNESQTAEQPLLLLPEERWGQIRETGTWEELFPANNPLNRSPLLASVAWWLTIAIAGWIALPFVRIAFPGLVDRGYAIARIAGLLIVGWLWWIVGSLTISTSRITLVGILAFLALLSGMLFWRKRQDWVAFLRESANEIILIEVLAVGIFLLDLGIRYANPDLWHPYKGGEKPMDLSYLTAVLKSASFPPYDPWFAGGYVNYYYFGFVFIGWPIKLLGIEPTMAYNLALPTLFSILATASYSAGYHLVSPWQGEFGKKQSWARVAGFSTAVGVVLMGNLGTVRMLFNAFRAIGGIAAGGLGFVGAVWNALHGFVKVMVGDASLPIALDHWYWNPSRAITPAAGETGPITEFPYFTFLYADLHAHLISLPLTVGALMWSISWLRWRLNITKPNFASSIAALAAGGLIIGSLRPTNTWDFPTYLSLGILAIMGSFYIKRGAQGLATGALWSAGLLGLSLLLYVPYSIWYELGYTRPELWAGSKTSPLDYLTIHGVFLFLLLGWFIWETREWMAATPLTSLNKLRGSLRLIIFLLVLWIVGLLTSLALGYWISIIVLPLITWAILLIIRPGQKPGKRFALALASAGLALTFMVEVVKLEGDIDRMNTVFKFYLQVWILLSLSAGAAFTWVISNLSRWWPWLRMAWSTAATILIMGGLLYPLTATPAKVRDRWSPTAPKTLRGMEYMKYASRSEQGETFQLQEDYAAIEWLRNNVQGTKVIVEANIAPYRWGSRMTIYTGLPGVLGWDWHQRQQRVVMQGDPIGDRRSAVTELYTTRSRTRAREIIQEYDIEYIVIGQLEHAIYETVEPCWSTNESDATVICDLAGLPVGMAAPPVLPSECTSLGSSANPNALSCPTGGLEKFEDMEHLGILEASFRRGGTMIYKVLRQEQP